MSDKTLPAPSRFSPFRPSFIIPAAITILAGIIRLHQLGFRSLWYDEAVLYWISQGSIQDVVLANAQLNSAPPLYALLIHYVSLLARSEAALRSVSWLAGTLSVPVFYALARRNAGLAASSAGALLLALSSTHIEYSQYLREYSLAFLAACFLILTYSHFSDHPTWRTCLITALAFCGAILIQYGLALLVAALMIALVLQSPKGSGRKGYLTKLVVIVALVLTAVTIVWFAGLRDQLRSGGFEYIQNGYWDHIPSTLPSFLARQSYEFLGFAFPETSLLILCLLIGAIARLLAPSRRWQFVLLLMPLVIAALVAIAGVYPLVGGRQCIYLVPVIFLVVAMGFDHLYTAEKKPLVFLVLLALMIRSDIIYTNKYFKSPPIQHIRPLVAYIQEHALPGDAIFVSRGGSWAFRYYYQGSAAEVVYAGPGEEWQSQLDYTLHCNMAVWLVISQDGQPEIYSEFASRRRPTELIDSNRGAVLYLSPTSAAFDGLDPVDCSTSR